MAIYMCGRRNNIAIGRSAVGAGRRNTEVVDEDKRARALAHYTKGVDRSYIIILSRKSTTKRPLN